MIRAVRLGKRYGGSWVFRGVDLELPDAGMAAVVGPNGSGKTTLLKTLAGLLKPDEGEVYIDGAPLAEALRRMRRAVLYAHQEPLVLAGTVEDNLICHDGDVLDALGLTPHLHRKARHLSGGYKKLLTIARVLTCRPKAALLDEPTAYLDADKRKTLMDYLRQYSNKALVLLTTHYPGDIPPDTPHYELRDGAIKTTKPTYPI
ncbi:ABC transporter ATP-binding protein [Pyrobaculum neutrophilum]|uniref:ABC transporter related n=1 Tax=Pyrobaculum neutrophilum (strain DSM 2338 / JCM 9278 / NBRC 100436 / V24Sta) TaxID=444157 RepID=B1YDN8_PYRNV|nr:ABC transporter ATP-binding protein [Pyrobaculum neutrophilum]ACB39901.1 ABC transporter related [Pyrobaculum neutrophilum V24Sta]